MKVLICGSRSITSAPILRAAMDLLPNRPTSVIHGGAGGVDALADWWCKTHMVTVECYPADWARHGKSAGPIRNRHMLHEGQPDAVLAVWDGRSRGTQHMIGISKKAGVPTYVYRTDRAPNDQPHA